MSAAFAHQFQAPSTRPVEDLYTNLGYARVLYDRLCVQMREFEESLGTALRAVSRSRAQLWRGDGARRPANGSSVPHGRSGTGMDLID